MNATRSDSLKRRSRRRPIRTPGSSPESLQRRIEASLTRRKPAASFVFNTFQYYTLLSLVYKLNSIGNKRQVKRMYGSEDAPPVSNWQVPDWLMAARSRGLLSRLPESLVEAVVRGPQGVDCRAGLLVRRWDGCPT